MFPWIPFLFGVRKSLSDIEYMSIKDFDGKRVDVDASTTVNATVTETDLATQTASSGKDMYLAKASCQVEVDLKGVDFTFIVKLYANGVQIDAKSFRALTVDQREEIDFKPIGVKVAATQIIKMTITHNVSSANTKTITLSQLMLFEESTGDSPQV